MASPGEDGKLFCADRRIRKSMETFLDSRSPNFLRKLTAVEEIARHLPMMFPITTAF